MIPCIHIKNDFQETKAETIKPNKTEGLSRCWSSISSSRGVVGLAAAPFRLREIQDGFADRRAVIINVRRMRTPTLLPITRKCKDLDEMLRELSTSAGRRMLTESLSRSKFIEIVKRKDTFRSAIKYRFIPLRMFIRPDGKYLVQRITGKLQRLARGPSRRQ